MHRAAAVLVLAAATAHADATVPADAAAEPLRCSYEDVGHFREARSERVKRAQALVGRELSFEQASARHLLFSDHYTRDRPGRAVLLDADSNAQVELDDGVVSFVEDPAGRVVALVALDANRHELRLLDGAGRLRWRIPYTSFHDSAPALIVGAQLVVATFHRYATGSALESYDLATGRHLWTADVEQLMVAHSKYYNDVTLDARDGRIVLRGIEAYGCYVQVFDAATGRRLSSRIVHPKP